MKTSVMLESYCAETERLARDGALRPALRMGAALPDLCAALERPQMQSSKEQYVAWCDRWLTWRERPAGKASYAERLYRLHTRRGRMPNLPAPEDNPTARALRRLRMVRAARRERMAARSPVWESASRLETCQRRLIEALVESTLRWYRERGATDVIVQRNLGLLLVSG